MVGIYHRSIPTQPELGDSVTLNGVLTLGVNSDQFLNITNDDLRITVTGCALWVLTILVEAYQVKSPSFEISPFLEGRWAK